MAEQFGEITEKLQAFIEQQNIFFVATADVDGKINLSPKGGDTLRVIGKNRVLWLNLTGSGNETAAHMRAVNRITLMFCSFERQPLILRIYGSGTIIHERDTSWQELVMQFPEHTGARQIFDIEVELAQTSCGYQVPYYEYQGERDTLDRWTANKGRAGIHQYWQDKNSISLDGKPTGI